MYIMGSECEVSRAERHSGNEFASVSVPTPGGGSLCVVLAKSLT